MQSFSSRIWTRVAVSISYDDNHYTTDIISYNELSFLVRRSPKHIILIVGGNMNA